MPSVAPSPEAPQPMNLPARPDPVAEAIKLALFQAHPDRPMPMDSEIARAARLAVNRIDPLQHGHALTVATQAVSRWLAAVPVIDAREVTFHAVITYLHALAEGDRS